MGAADPETSKRLVEQAPEILRRWERRVRAGIPASRDQRRPVLQSNLGAFLLEVARALAPTGERAATIAGLTLSQDHGGHRAGLAAYSLDEVFLEYRLLRQTVLEVLDEGQSLDAAAREVISDALERAMQDAVSQFARTQQDVLRNVAEEAWRVTAELQTAYERERRIAQVLQRPLRIRVAEDAVAGLSLTTLYEPAWKEALVGGDFFDVIPLVGGHVALVVGDTCGKGLEAAVHNTHVKDVLRAFLRESPPHPGAIVARLNNVVCDSLVSHDPDQEYRFVVLSLLILKPDTGDALFSSAGAEPLLVVRSGGEVEVVSRPALALGIERDTQYEDTPLRLELGDTTVQVTDGITEAKNGRDLLGYPAMVEIVRQALQAASLQAAGEEILAKAQAHAHGKLSDDVCLILARRTGD